ncbi:MAG: (Fe-S)-binding protein [Nitrospirota bacterium]
MKKKKVALTGLQLIELDACTGCGQCLKFCPVQAVTGDASISPPEKIRHFKYLLQAQGGGVLSRLFRSRKPSDEEMEKFVSALFKCTTCGVCGTVCPVGINTQKLWAALRTELIRMGKEPPGKQKDVPDVFRRRKTPYEKDVAEKPLWRPAGLKNYPSHEIGYFVGCGVSFSAPPMALGGARMLESIYGGFTMLEIEECCGFPLYVLGFEDIIESMVRKNVAGLVGQGVKKLVTTCACCMSFLTNNWPKYTGGKLPFEVVHISQEVARAVETGVVAFKKELKETVCYHDPCYISRGKPYVVEEPRRVITSIPGVIFKEMERNRQYSKCCGAGGGIRRVQDEEHTKISCEIALEVIKDAEAEGADTLAINCPACYERMHLALTKLGYETKLKIKDIMQMASEQL